VLGTDKTADGLILVARDPLGVLILQGGYQRWQGPPPAIKMLCASAQLVPWGFPAAVRRPAAGPQFRGIA
jgi:hypothetical protein